MEEETIDVEFLIFCMVSLILVITTLLISQVVQSNFLADYSNLYTILTITSIMGLFVLASVYKYEWKFAGLAKTVTSTLLTTVSLFAVMIVFSGLMKTPDIIGIPVIPEFSIPEKIPVEVELTPGQSIFKGYLSLATILGIPVNILISALLMFPAGFSESIFQTALPRLLKSAFKETTLGEVIGVTASNLIFAILHFITYGFSVVTFTGAFIGGMVMSITYRYHKSQVGLGMGHTLYNLMLLALTPK
jgi:membrane protease YdiL (CAAX protease family)